MSVHLRLSVWGFELSRSNGIGVVVISVRMSTRRVPPGPSVIRVESVAKAVCRPGKMLQAILPVPNGKMRQFKVASIKVFRPSVVFSVTVRVGVRFLVTVIPINVVGHVYPKAATGVGKFVVVQAASVIVVVGIVCLGLAEDGVCRYRYRRGRFWMFGDWDLRVM